MTLSSYAFTMYLNTMIAKFEIHALLIQNRNEERREKVRATPSNTFLGAGKGKMPVWIFNTGGRCGYVYAHVSVCTCVCVCVCMA